MISKIIIYPLVFCIKLYQILISPFLGQNCRYLPTCSEYSVESLNKFGLIKGFCLSFKRICKCHPFGNHGYDPVPNKLEEK